MKKTLQQGLRAFVTNQNSQNVSVIDLTSNQTIDTITVGTYPTGIALAPNGIEAYVTNSDSGTISIINLENNTVTTTLPVGDFPYAIAFDPSETTAYVTNVSSQDLSIIQDDHVVSTIPLNTEPLDLVVSPDGKVVYITTFFSSKILLLDVLSGKIVNTIEFPSRTLLRKMVISSDGSYGYVTNSSPKGHYVTILDLPTYKIIDTITVGEDPSGIVLTSDGFHAYVTHLTSNNVYLLDLQSKKVLNQLSVEGTPFELALTPDESLACVVNNNTGSNSVSILDLGSFTVMATVEVGTNPYGVVIR